MKTLRLISAIIISFVAVKSTSFAETKAIKNGKDYAIPEIGIEFVWINTMKMWAGKYEVTNGEFRKYKTDHDSKKFEGFSLNGDRQPVVNITFEDALEYAKWLTGKEKEAGRLPEGLKFRLPSVSEWRKFSRCGEDRGFPWGKTYPQTRGNYLDVTYLLQIRSKTRKGYNDGSAVSCDVEKSGKNEWGLYAVGGNVEEVTVKDEDKKSFAGWCDASWLAKSELFTKCDHLRISTSSDALLRSGFRLVLSRD